MLAQQPLSNTTYCFNYRYNLSRFFKQLFPSKIHSVECLLPFPSEEYEEPFFVIFKDIFQNVFLRKATVSIGYSVFIGIFW